jgi:N-acetylmuramoyl-L-alanine amidase
MRIRRTAGFAALFVAMAMLSTVFLCGSATASAAASTNVNTIINKDFKVTADKYYNQMGYSNNHYEYTEAELKMLAIVIYLEARGSPTKAKIAVGNVVMNRVLSPGYPGSTIQEVVTRPNQFAYNSSTNPTADCYAAAREVLDHEVWVVPQNTYFFKMSKSTSNWGAHKYYTNIDGTAFYTDSKYAGRYNGTSLPPSLYTRTFKWPQYGCKPAARVRRVQTMLKSLGYDKKLVTDGYFGANTKKVVLAFQKANGLVQDGIVGPNTLTKMLNKYGVTKYSKLK